MIGIAGMEYTIIPKMKKGQIEREDNENTIISKRQIAINVSY